MSTARENGGVLAILVVGPDSPSTIGAVASTLGNVGPGLGAVGAIGNNSAVQPVGEWVLPFLMMIGRLEIFPVILILRRSFLAVRLKYRQHYATQFPKSVFSAIHLT